MPSGKFRTPAMEHPRPWSRVCTRPIVNIICWFPHQFKPTSTYLYIDVCGLERIPEHMPRYMGRTSNNNKILINNLSCCFVSRVVYTQNTVTWGIRYIYSWGFLCLDYSFNILVSWSRKLNLYSWLCLYSILSILLAFYQFSDVFLV